MPVAGAAKALGKFTTGDSDLIGFSSGIILSTGFVTSAVGPNEDEDVSGDNGKPGDTDLDGLLDPNEDRRTEDATVLEFDFVPTSNKVSFRYVFGSEEYLDFVEQGYNDVFGFFVNGQNCAVVGSDPVSVDSINDVRNSQFFRDNTSGVLNTEMDGLTTVLTCVADVNQGQTNHRNCYRRRRRLNLRYERVPARPEPRFRRAGRSRLH